MTASVGLVTFSPRDWACECQVFWDEPARVLSFALHRSPAQGAGPAGLLRERIDQALGIEPPAFGLSFGPLELQLDSDGQLLAGEIRSNPARWLRQPLLPPASPVQALAAQWHADFDLNGLFTADVRVEVDLDLTARAISLRLPGAQATQWGELADGLWLGLGAHQPFCELRLNRLPPELLARFS
jgi:hypothetical protein